MPSIVLMVLFPLIALIAIGYILKKSQFLDQGFWKGAERLNYYVLFPAMLFLNLAYADINLSAMSQMLVGIFITLTLACIILYSLKYWFKTPVARFGVYVQGNIRFNTYIGLAIITSLLHQQGMALFAIILALCIPVVNVLSILAMTKKQDMKPINIIYSLGKNPLVMGCVVGIAFNVIGLQLWEGTENLLNQLGRCSLVLGLLTVGAALQFDSLKDEFSPLLINTFTRLLAMPLVALIIAYIIDLPKLETQVMVLFFALPTASASYVLTKMLGGDSNLMASVISLQTLCAAFTLPLIILMIL